MKRSRAGLQLDLVAVGVAEVERRPLAVGAVTADDAALEGDARRLERLRHTLQVVPADREADVVEGAARLAVSGGGGGGSGVARTRRGGREPFCFPPPRA